MQDLKKVWFSQFLVHLYIKLCGLVTQTSIHAHLKDGMISMSVYHCNSYASCQCQHTVPPTEAVRSFIISTFKEVFHDLSIVYIIHCIRHTMYVIMHCLHYAWFAFIHNHTFFV